MRRTRIIATIGHGFLPGVSGATNTIQDLDMQEYLAGVSFAAAAKAGALDRSPPRSRPSTLVGTTATAPTGYSVSGCIQSKSPATVCITGV